MSDRKPTYEEPEARLTEAEAVIEVLRSQQVDAIVGEEHVALVRLKEVEEALRESEQRYRRLFEGIGDAVMVYSSQGRFLDCNEATLQRLGYSPEELFRLRAADIVHPGFHQLMKDNQERIWGGEATVVESAHRCKDGRVIPVEVNAHVIEYQGEAAILAVVRDITERKRAEEERRRLLADLEAKNRELESFVYSVSHDLRAPLVSLDGFSHLLYKDLYDQLGDQGPHYLDRIQANVSHMNALISELLELARIGQVVGPTEEIDVAVLLRETQEELAIKLEEAGAELVVQEPLPTVHADRGRIRQVFTNLIENAIKFRSQERPLRIEVGCQQEGGFYRFHVADNGIGIAPQYHELIFATFRQLDPQTEGVGMGLALVKKIVEHHGGRVWVESEEGSGATFYFTLPNPCEG